MLGDSLAFSVRANAGDVEAKQRAKRAEKVLREVFDSTNEEDVRVERAPEVAVIYLGQTPIIQLGPQDALANGESSLDAHADAVAAQLRSTIAKEKARNALARRLFGISMVVLFGVIVLYLLRKTGEFTERANAWLDDNPQRVPALRVRSVTLLTPAAVRSGSALALGVGKWLLQFAVVYWWIIAALNQFVGTRGYTQRINTLILEPFVELTTRVVSTLPITVVVAIAGLVMLLLLRVVGLFFEAVRDGTTLVPWLPADLAEPTRFLSRLGIVLVTLVFAAPVLTGHAEGALARAGFIGMVTLGLACTPLVANGALGAYVAFGRRLRVGQRVTIGEVSGEITRVTLFDVVLHSQARDVRVPHLLSLVRVLSVHAERAQLVEFSLPVAFATKEFEQCALGRLRAELGDARLELVKLEAHAASYHVHLEHKAAQRELVLKLVNDARQTVPGHAKE